MPKQSKIKVDSLILSKSFAIMREIFSKKRTKMDLESFKNEIKDGFVIADFYAPWCGDCVRIAPILNELSQSYKIIKVNIDESEGLANEFEISRIPTLIFFKDGAEVGNRLVEPKSKTEILNEIERIK